MSGFLRTPPSTTPVRFATGARRCVYYDYTNRFYLSLNTSDALMARVWKSVSCSSWDGSETWTLGRRGGELSGRLDFVCNINGDGSRLQLRMCRSYVCMEAVRRQSPRLQTVQSACLKCKPNVSFTISSPPIP